MRRSNIIVTGVSIIVLILGFIVYFLDSENIDVSYRLANVERGTIQKLVSASGGLNAVVTVEVGSGISGQISELLADFNTNVKAGQIIARIDPESFIARVQQVEAELSVAKALVATKKAAVVQSVANLGNANAIMAAAAADVSRTKVTATDFNKEFVRKASLRKKGVVAISVVDKARASWLAATKQVSAAESQLVAKRSTVDARTAQVAMAKADVQHALAQVKQKSAALNIARVNYENTFIRSPVDGVVIGRDVDVGQTVAASLQAPILFTIAQNLREMQVETNIDEADIGQIRTGQKAKFSVDSFPGQEFKGVVRQIRKKPKTVQNVVTYTVVIAANNSNLRLLPGMTANVTIEVSTRQNVLKLPNRALRFQPPGQKGKLATSQLRRHSKGPPNAAARRARAQARMRRLIETLGLTSDQQQQVREFAQSLRPRIRALAQATERGPGFREGIRKLRQENSIRIFSILDSEQQVKYSNMINAQRSNPELPGTVWILENGTPKLVNVTIGVGDGNSTELIGGGIKEGQEVIVGIKRS